MKLLRLDEVRAMTGVSTTGIYRHMATGNFPRQVRVTPNCVGWLESEIVAFVNSRVGERDTAPQTKRRA